MKPIKIHKKLELHKEDVANLDKVRAGNEDERCPGPVCGSGSAYVYWQTYGSCPPTSNDNVRPELCIL
jgi:hypothetical protein